VADEALPAARRGVRADIAAGAAGGCHDRDRRDGSCDVRPVRQTRQPELARLAPLARSWLARHETISYRQ